MKYTLTKANRLTKQSPQRHIIDVYDEDRHVYQTDIVLKNTIITVCDEPLNHIHILSKTKDGVLSIYVYPDNVKREYLDTENISNLSGILLSILVTESYPKLELNVIDVLDTKSDICKCKYLGDTVYALKMNDKYRFITKSHPVIKAIYDMI